MLTRDDTGVLVRDPMSAVAPARPPAAVDRWFPVVAFAVVASVVVVVSLLAFAHLPLMHLRQNPGTGWTRAFGWWDGWWYEGIARRGYYFMPYRQSPVAFFPLYPLLMRGLGPLVGGPLVAGFGITLAAGAASAVLFHRWCVGKLGASTAARLAVLLLLLYPCAFYLMGTIYADALFLAAVLAAFVALEADQPLVAGLAGAVATATRPTGLAVVAGLWLVAWQRRGVGRRGGFWRSRAWVLLAPLGLAAYAGFLAVRFSDPFRFLEAASAPGWAHHPGPHTWLKVQWLTALLRPAWDGHHGHLLGNALATAVAAALLPAVFRRFGWGYGIYASLAVVGAAVFTKDFVGMGRYVLAAFPVFAVAADLLVTRGRRWLTVAILVASGAGLLMLTQLHARGTIIS